MQRNFILSQYKNKIKEVKKGMNLSAVDASNSKRKAFQKSDKYLKGFV